ncbi:MAG: DUF4388 domain-containing protein, partial [Gemmatimonadetes bacterium]|nr:DUF4388 domain-containing protein [Gemmatimonadota bacterium]
MVAIQGKLEEAALPDVLQLLALGKKTGCLALTDGVLQGNIYLDTGRITYAAVANRRDRLGDMLIKSGRITREQLAEAIGQQSAGHKRLGEILVASGRVARAELERFAQVQVEEAVYFLFTWRKGTFTFESNVRPEGQDFLASINPEGLLLEGARRIDEWSLIEKKIPSFDMVFRVDRARLSASDVTLTEEQRRIVPLLDGQHDVHAVVEATALAEFDVGKALYGLVSAGFAQLVERRATVRHLDYRELLAYLVHEAEFADPERRKQATRHIVDCKLCAPRLKEIHVRRTQETRADEVAQALAEPARAAPAAAPPALAVLAAPARSSGQRRSGGGKAPRDASGTTDRRRGQRRAADRRRAVAAAPPAGLGERRAGGERRHAERRLQDRLGIALARATTGAAVKGAVPQRTERSRRNTGPRRLTTLAPERRPGAAPSPKPDVTRPAAAESPPEPAVAPAGAVATAATAAASVPTAESQPSASAPAPVRTAPAAKPPAPTG